jgi:hypothetical protein
MRKRGAVEQSGLGRGVRCGAIEVALTDREREWGVKASRFLKAELKGAGIRFKELAERLNRHGLEESETSITGKLARGTVLEIEGVRLDDL